MGCRPSRIRTHLSAVQVGNFIFIVYRTCSPISIGKKRFDIYRLYDIESKRMDAVMSSITKSVGKRIRNYRTQQGLSQEKLASLSGCHPTYIGQLERGEKNATLESVEKIAVALNVSLSALFEKLGGEDRTGDVPLECYEFLSAKPREEQEQLYRILLAIDKYKCK